MDSSYNFFHVIFDILSHLYQENEKYFHRMLVGVMSNKTQKLHANN